MPCTGLSIASSNISCLNFNVAWDISGATPTVTITNTSTVANYTKLKWWFYVVSPSGASIYGVDLDTASPLPTPDVTGVSWTTKQITLPTPFGNPPCGQVEFSPTNPYTVFVYVQDIDISTTTFFTYNKTALIVRPAGNSINSCGNFGNAAVSMKVDCLARNIMVFDSTILIYNNILTPLSTSNLWNLVYPEDNSGDIPNVTVADQPNVNFPISVNSNGYILYFQEYATYDYGNGVTVKVQYKLFSKGGSLGRQFAINCNTNLCLLQCQMQKFYELSKGTCGVLENAELTQKMVRMNWVFSEILTGIFQPLCGIDVPKLMDEIKRIGNFDDNCDCNCGSGDFGFSNPTGAGNISGSCCPISANVIDINTGNPPINCPNGYFPASIYDPTGVTVIGVALSMADEINIINGNAAWQAYGTAFSEGNCKVGFFPRPGVVTVPPIKVDPNNGGGNGGGVVIVNVVDPYGYPPGNCVTGYFPVQVYDPTGAIVIGVANNISEVVSIINANTAWQAYGTAFPVDNCHIGFYPKPGGPPVIPPVVVTPGGGGGCVNGKQLYSVSITDICYPSTPPITAGSFPLNIYIDFGLGAGLQFVGNATSQANMVTLLNAAPGKPASVTFSAGATVDQIIVTNTNCTAYSGLINIKADSGSNSYLLFSGNHINLGASSGITVREEVFGIKALADLGGIATGNPVAWHTIKIGNILAVTQPSSGEIRFWDISNPLNPILTRVITLNDISGTCFQGLPDSVNILSPITPLGSFNSLYFPTDYYGTMSLSEIYIVEAVTGSLWKLNYYATGSGVTTSFQNNRLIGKCPRVLTTTHLYFTQDGDLETATSQSSGVAIGDIVILDLGDLSNSGLSTKTILLNQVEYVWAASYDGMGNIYFTGNRTSVVKYNIAADTLTRYLYTGGVGLFMQYRANSVYFQGKLFVTPQHLPGYNGMIIDTTTLGGVVSIGQFQIPTGSTIDGLFNFMPLGNCFGVLTSARTAAGDPAHVALYFLDGSYMARFSLLVEQEYYNVIPVGNVPITTPNSYIP